MSAADPRIGIVWFRRDLRLADNRTLRRALDECDEIIPLFVVDDRCWEAAGANRRWFLAGCLADLDEQLDGRLVVRHDDPVTALTDLVHRYSVTRLYRAADAGPAGRRRDAEVDDALREQIETVVVDQPYVVALGSSAHYGGRAIQGVHPVLASLAPARRRRAAATSDAGHNRERRAERWGPPHRDTDGHRLAPAAG